MQGNLSRDYLEHCQKAEREPDSEILRPVVEKMQELENGARKEAEES